MSELTAAQLAIIRAILASHVPGATVRLYGSRVAGGARPHSDLDLVVDAGSPLDLGVLGDLREAFQESDLPFRVDLLDWHRASPSFRRAIRDETVALPQTSEGASPSSSADPVDP